MFNAQDENMFLLGGGNILFGYNTDS